MITQLKKEKLALRTWLFQQTSIYKKVMSLSDQQQVNKKIRKVMAAAELDKLKKTTFEIYADYISPLQAQYSQLTEDDLLVLCLQEAGYFSVGHFFMFRTYGYGSPQSKEIASKKENVRVIN